MAIGITIIAGPSIFVFNLGKLNCFISSALNPENISSSKSSVNTESELFLNKSMLSDFSLWTAITFPNILNLPPNSSDTLSFDKYCS